MAINNNTLISISAQTLTMSSMEISELVGSRHDKVKQSIGRLANRKIIQIPPLGITENINGLGLKQRTEHYTFSGERGKRDSIIVVAQLCPEFTAKLVDRWQELEQAITAPQIPQSLPEALRLAADLAEEKAQLQTKVIELEPKAEFHDKVAAAPDAISLAKAAKILGTGRNRLCSYLKRIGWLTRHNEPYQTKIEAGLLDVKLGNWQHPDHGLQQSVTPLITGKGLVKLESLMKSGGAV